MTDSLLSGEGDLTPQIDEDKDYYTELVGEGKKFKDQKSLARGKYEADVLIETMKRQQDDLRAAFLKEREENTQRAKLEDLINKLEEKRLASSEQPPANEEKKPEIDMTKLESLIESKYKEYDSSKKQTENFNFVRTKLQEQYGEKYQTVLKSQIEELDLSQDYVDTMARNNPKALLKLLEAAPSQGETFQAPPRTQSNSAFKPKAGERTWSYYQEMKKSDPKKYFDPKTTVQMTQDYARLGPQFEDGNFGEYDRPGYLKFNQ